MMQSSSPGEIVTAAAVAGTLSGIPSTLHAITLGHPPLSATRAAGQLLGGPGVTRGVMAHVVVSLWWTTALATIRPQRRPMLWGAVTGGAIAVVDLSIARHRFPAIAALPTAGQVADHVAFGALAAAMLPRRRR